MQDIKHLIVLNFQEEQKILTTNEKFDLLNLQIINKNISKIGNIYAAQVQKIDYALEAVFVSLDNTSGFLPFKYLNKNYMEDNKVKFQEGQKILVQIQKDAVDKKSCNVTTFISLFGKNLIFLPYTENKNGISSNIKGNNKIKMKEFLKQLITKESSLIIRTNSFEAEFEIIKQDYIEILESLKKILKEFKDARKPKLIYQFDNFFKNLLSHTPINKKMYFLNISDLKKTQQLLKINDIKIDLELIQNQKIIKYIKDQLHDVYSFKIKLNCGGNLILYKTEACFVFDINSAKFNDSKNLEDTVFTTNLEAAKKIVQQIFLKNLSGIIIIDFIDMKNEDHKKIINEEILKGFKNDKNAIKILKINELGIMQISRQKIQNSFLEKLERCYHCDSFGYINKHIK